MMLNLTIARQMIGGELLRLRKKRGFIALALLVVIAPVVIVYGYNVIEHASDPAKHGPAGGLHNYTDLLAMLGLFMGPVAAILIGAEAGAGDVTAGVFRDNVLTGRSRTALFLARIPAALAVSLSVTAVGFVIGVVGTFAFAGGLYNAERVSDPRVRRLARARECGCLRCRDRPRIVDGLAAGHDHRAARVAARSEPAATPRQLARLDPARLAGRGCAVPQSRPCE